MAFPRKLLVPGEDLVLELRPHPAALAGAALVTLVSVVLGAWLAAKANGVLSWIVIAAVLIVLVWYPVRRLVAWLTTIFVVSTQRVIHRQGWIARRSMEIPLDKINDVRFEQSIIERLIGAGTLIIQSASEAGRNEFEHIRHPEDVQRTIYEVTQRDKQPTQMSAPATPAAPMSPAGQRRMAPQVTTELERLADLRARGVLTEDEFQAQKARILGQS
ncbi:MAG: PH domain-containing protein [Actinomycetota bacterium]|nr:PH domain-containing protein [Actinomycetota bacterium]